MNKKVVCRECKHSFSFEGGYPLCKLSRYETKEDIIMGISNIEYEYCEDVRNGACGHEGKFFEKRHGSFHEILKILGFYKIDWVHAFFICLFIIVLIVLIVAEILN